ncbi:MAG: MotA/TolQ/ExbB proton channel family protein [Magnetococcales bacterium]|nr:MotA/TolQ/ExbB proton channel family protein [Magnetococcales bacterium]
MAWWIDSDGVVKAIFVILLALSVSGWAIILHKWMHLNRLLGTERRLRDALEREQPVELAASLLGEVVALARVHPETHWEARMAHTLREQRVNLESGLTFLASIGVSTPFIGLLGTVWGIMHALAGLGHNASLSLDLVAGPVAEALVATAAGLFAAIPAAVGYNLLVRRLRRLMTMAEGNLLRLLVQKTERRP